MKVKVLITIIMAATLLQGCVYATGIPHDDDGDRFAREPTIGQELLDLDRARAAGAITGAEYDRLKAIIIEGLE